MSIQIFHVRSALPLPDFASAVFGLLEIESFQERDSDNYPGGYYYRGIIEDITVLVCEESDEGWEDYQHWVVLDADLGPEETRLLTEGMIGRLLADGFHVAREAGHDEKSILREFYRRDHDVITTVTETRMIEPQ